MPDRNRTRQADSSLTSSLPSALSAPVPVSLPATHAPAHSAPYASSFAPSGYAPSGTSQIASLPADRRSISLFPPMGAADNGFTAGGRALRRRAAQWAGLVHLPTTFQGYMVFTFCLLILAFTMMLHITLSAEILGLNERLLALKDEYAAIERSNADLIFNVARQSSLQDVNRKALLAGYVPADKYKYVVERPDVAAALAAGGANDTTQPEAPQYLVLGPTPAPPAPAAPAAEEPTGFWSRLRWSNVRDGWNNAWGETGAWLRSWLPAWGNP